MQLKEITKLIRNSSDRLTD